MATALALTDATFHSPRHTTYYWEAGPAGGPLMIFLHGWPEIGLVWRAQVEAFATGGGVTRIVEIDQSRVIGGAS